MKTITNIIKETMLLCYPHHCCGCGKDSLMRTELICTQCLHDLPYTNFEMVTENPVLDILKARLPIHAAAAIFYFNKGNIIQHILHELKYKQNREIGIYLGGLMGEKLLTAAHYKNIDALIPLPLFAAKELQRGYNQAELICQGISDVTNIPVMKKLLIRKRATQSQTRKHRAERWENVNDSFNVINSLESQNKHVLLVDDVLTTGATLEAAGKELTAVPGLQLSVVTAAVAYS